MISERAGRSYGCGAECSADSLRAFRSHSFDAFLPTQGQKMRDDPNPGVDDMLVRLENARLLAADDRARAARDLALAASEREAASRERAEAARSRTESAVI